ncbi:cupredoxin domain-containing protein [Natrinema altunense]|uniref:Blue (type 1) copper domain-containing protein n=1 Tax=Natrinema altunense TaxID=222984 RepID=A0A482Y112_9EURY|nr:plastocyanin/azurin family copper-binding protein [Natrinema altunense]RZH68023.1 hypothetical protein ELS17_00705 [Natrinema altunense]
MTRSERTRRTALELIGTTAAATGVAGAVTAQENGNEEEEETDRRPIILAGRIDHWYGIAPEEIEGEENPTLEFEDGEAYELVWINADGAEHELVLESDDGEELEESDSSETGGETVSVTFEADEDVTEYYCAFHPESMRGDVEFDGGFDL